MKDKQKRHLIKIMQQDENDGLYDEPKLQNICIKCGVDLHIVPNFICQMHPKECKGIHIDEETLREWANRKQHLIDMMASDEEDGLY